MKIKYQEVKRVSNEMLGYVSNMERILAGFKNRTANFTGEMQDQISEQAVELVNVLAEEVKKLRAAIEKGAQTVVTGTERLNATEKKRSGEIGRI